MRPWILAAVLLLSPVAFAQNAGAPDPGPGNPFVYAHGNADGDDEVLWMNADKDDPDATDTANGPGYTCTFQGGGPADDPACTVDGTAGAGITDSTVEDIEHTFTIPLEPGLDGDVVLHGMIRFTVALGANSGEGSGEVVARLLDGETTIAETEPFAFAYNGGYELFTAEAVPSGDTIAAGGDLVWEIDVDGEASGLFLGVHDSTARTFFEVVQPPPPPTTFHDVEDDHLAASLDLDGTAMHQFNWTAPEGPLSLFVQGTVEAGSLSIAILDGSNATLLDETFTAEANVTQTLNGTAGAWRVFLNSTDAAGGLSILIADPEDTGPDSDPGDDADADDQDADDGTGNTTDGGKDSPAVGALLVLVAVFAVLAIRRR